MATAQQTALLIAPKARATEHDVLKQAAKALREHERLTQALRANENELRRLCREYDLVAGVWGFQQHHLRRACEARGLL